MTSRIKHKLELENVNLKSAHLNESFVKIGTPLPALSETKKDKQEFLPLWEQEVRDEKGRKRFHGAFTGGYSAGYFNSVGSKEGWAPQQFKSSRSNRAAHMQRADDFMDDEDRIQMNEDRRLENTDSFRSDQFAGTRDPSQSTSLSSALQSLVVPAKSSIGQKLLQKLGWRPGQGLGPRVTLRKLKIQEGKLGKARVGIEEDDVEEAGKHTYAPRDTRLLVFDPKEDKEGLGFQKGAGMGSLPPKRPMHGAGMGDDDDDDPYGAAPSTGLDDRHYAFDAAEEEDDVIVMGGAPSSRNPRDTVGGAASSEGYWHDGRPVLVGFVLDIKGVPADKWWPFADTPSDWKPDPSRVWDANKPSEAATTADPQRAVPGGPPLTHAQRGEALGEEPRVSAAKSVWEFMSEKDRERLQAFAAAAKAGKAPPPSLSMEVEPELAPEKVSEIVIPPLSPRTASSALHGFMPHGDDPHKQERYRSYLVSQTYNTKHPNPQLLPSTNIEDVNNELESFAQSARIFRPMSHAMSSRFTSGSSSLASTDTQQPKAGLHILDPKGPLMQFAKASTEVEPEKTLTPREQAAADGKFGALTRVVKDFYPVKLVCKRFHVPNPHPEGPPEGGDSGSATPAAAGGQSSSAGGPSWMSGFVHQVETEKENKPPSEDEKEEEFTGERLPRSINEVGMAEDANQGRDILTYVKPSIDIFKAIFASDDEDDDDDDQPKPPTVPSVPSKFASRKQDASNQPQPEEKPVDYNTFKPVFRRTDEVKPEDDKDKTQRKKEKKDKKKRKGALSFDVGDNDEEAPREKPKKKAKSRREEVAEEWVEKAPVVLPQSAPAAVPSSNQTEPSTNEADQASSVPKFVRKGAADLW